MCQAFDTEYQNATAARNDELDLLGKLVAFVRQQEDIFGNFGNDGVDAFDEYKNQADAQRQDQRNNFMQLKIKQFKMSGNLKKIAPSPSKCSTCSRKSFVQKKLGF